MKKSYLILSIVIAFALLSRPTCAYANGVIPRLGLGYVWKDTPVTIFFTCDFEADEREAVRAAMATWNSVKSAEGSSIVTLFLKTGEAENIVERVSSFWGWVGYCDVTSSQGEIVRVRVKLGSEYNWSTTGATDAYDIQTVVLHELGHALGIAHCHEADEGVGPCWSSTCLTNAMNPVVSLGEINTTLKSYDTSSYRVLYY